ncbi:MAG: cysteine methyltransferase [Gammaproteobacteria bacterium]|nr:MAG: cysteine methyltransferase [Gammaproteobacteria bacterium]
MTNTIHIGYHDSTIGEMVIGSFDDSICLLDFRYRRMRNTVDKRIKNLLRADFVEKEDSGIRATRKQIDEYLQGQRQQFTVPILLLGTDFQKQVWNALLDIAYGETVSYLQVARKIRRPKAVRAVASANGANAIALIVPCHRVIESGGGLGGYGGGIAVKKQLLDLETHAKHR